MSSAGSAGDAAARQSPFRPPAGRNGPSPARALFGDRELDLAPKEFEFLAYLARHAGKVCTRRMILENVWGPGYARELHYLKVYAYRIRRKLHDEAGQFLQSDPAVGYRLATPGE